MITPIPLLQNVRVASPCEASWEDMQAVEGDRVHFCMGCQKNVYNLSAMSQWEAEGLLRRHEGRLCVRYYQRQDGTVLSGDCPLGAHAVRMSLMRRSTMAAGLFAMLFGAMAAMNLNETRPVQPPAAQVVPVPIKVETPPVMQGDVTPTPAPERPVMGKMRMPEPKPMPLMGVVSLPPESKPEVQDTVGHISLQAPKAENTLDSNSPKAAAMPSEKDTTDEAILKPKEQ